MAPTWTFRRSAGDTKLAGVCGGIAERGGVDPVLVRVGFVLLALTGGVGVVLYLAGWLLLPVDGSDRAAVDDLFGGAAARWPRELWITLVVVACLVSFVVFSAVSPFGVAPALVLAALWWFGFRKRGRSGRAAGAKQPGASPYAVHAPGATPPVTWVEPSTPFGHAAAAWQARVAEVRGGVWDTPPWSAPPPPDAPAPGPSADEVARAAFLAEPDPVGLYTDPAPVPVVRPGATLAARRLRLTTVAALGLTWLGLGIADALGAAVSLAVYAAAGLLVVALGLVAATRWGRARGLLPAGALLAVAAIACSGLLSTSVAGPANGASRLVEHPVAYTSAAAFPAGGDTLDFGDLDVDLRGLALTGDATYTATVDTGRVAVRTPPGAGVAVRYAVDTGDVEAYGAHLGSGSEVHGERLLVAPAAGQHTLTLDLTVDTGAIEVLR